MTLNHSNPALEVPAKWEFGTKRVSQVCNYGLVCGNNKFHTSQFEQWDECGLEFFFYILKFKKN